MSTAVLAVRRNQNLVRNKASLHLGPVSATIITVAMVSILALLYLNQITKTSIYGYQRTELVRERDKIAARKQELEVEVARLQSVRRIQSSPVVASMVAEGPVSYAK